MQVEHRIHLGMFIERALFELYAISLDRYAHRHGALYLKDRLHHYVEFFPVLNLNDYLHLFTHPLKDDPHDFVRAMRDVLRDMLINNKSKLRLAASMAYFQTHPTAETAELIEQMDIYWDETEQSYWTDTYFEFSSNFSYSSYPYAMAFTNVSEVQPVNAVEEKYFAENNFLAILSLRDLSAGIGLYTDTFADEFGVSSEEKACRDFISLLITEHYLPTIMDYDAELRTFIRAIEDIIEKKFDILLNKRTRGIYTNEWGVSNRAQWDQDLEYFVDNLVLPTVGVPSFLLGLRISSRDFVDYVERLGGEEISHAVITHGLRFAFSDIEFKELYQVSNTVYRANVAKEIEALCDFLIYIRILSMRDPSSETVAPYTLGESDDFAQDQDRGDNIDVVRLRDMYEQQIKASLEELDYSVSLTSEVGDQGVDLIAERDGVTYAIQCQYSFGQVSNTAVQEVFAGKFYYNCQHACVITNAAFAPQAYSLAHKTGVILCPENDLQVFH